MKPISELTPRDYRLPYDNWRKYQHETIQWTLDIRRNGNGLYVPKITAQVTGSGKSPVAMALNGRNNEQVIVLTHSRNLQVQYANLIPDCHAHFGRSNYKCIHPKKRFSRATAEDCLYGSRMRQCPIHNECPYVISKIRALSARRVVLNYAYWLVASRHFRPDWLVFDEAHNLSDIVLEFVGMTITERDRTRWNLDEFPQVASPKMIAPNNTRWCDSLIDWLSKASTKVRLEIAKLEPHPGETYIGIEESLEEVKAGERLITKLENTEDALSTDSGNHWFISCGPEAHYYHGKAEPALICKPLTARYDFSRLFGETCKKLFMSATIGNPKAFTKELGIKEYDFREVPNQWPPESRPILALDLPSMGRRSTGRDETIWNQQADAIAHTIKQYPKDWSGLILVTRKNEANKLAERLAKRGLDKRLFITPGADGHYVPTEQQMQKWNEEKTRCKGALCCTWAFWEGFDGQEERILIAGKVPFPDISSAYERSRMQYDNVMFLQRTGLALEQGLGRTRRGEEGDYDTKDEVRGCVAIADGDWTRVKNYMSEGVKEAIIDERRK